MSPQLREPPQSPEHDGVPELRALGRRHARGDVAGLRGRRAEREPPQPDVGGLSVRRAEQGWEVCKQKDYKPRSWRANSEPSRAEGLRRGAYLMMLNAGTGSVYNTSILSESTHRSLAQRQNASALGAIKRRNG